MRLDESSFLCAGRQKLHQIRTPEAQIRFDLYSGSDRNDPKNFAAPMLCHVFGIKASCITFRAFDEVGHVRQTSEHILNTVNDLDIFK